MKRFTHPGPARRVALNATRRAETEPMKRFIETLIET
jgi:hypothetical protein